MPANPYESPKQCEPTKPTKAEISILWCIPLAFGGMLLAIKFLSPYLAFTKGSGDMNGYSRGGLIGGFIGLAIGLSLRLLFPPAHREEP